MPTNADGLEIVEPAKQVNADGLEIIEPTTVTATTPEKPPSRSALSTAVDWTKQTIAQDIETVKRPFRDIGRATAATGQYFRNVALALSQDVSSGAITRGAPSTVSALNATPQERPVPQDLPSKIAESVVGGAGEMVPALAATAAGVPAPIAFGTQMGLQTYGETGDAAHAARQAATGFLLGKAGEAGAALGERIGLEAAAKVPAEIGEAAVEASKFAGQQVALNALMTAGNAPELVRQWRENPSMAVESLSQQIGANLAFSAPQIPHVIQRAMGKNMAEAFVASPEYKDWLEHQAQAGGKPIVETLVPETSKALQEQGLKPGEIPQLKEPSAIPIQEPVTGVLRGKTPEPQQQLGLPQVGARDKGTQEPAGTEVPPTPSGEAQQQVEAGRPSSTTSAVQQLGQQIGSGIPDPVTTVKAAIEIGHDVADALQNLASKAAPIIRGAAGHSLPRTTAMNTETGEAGVRYASSRIAAPLKAIQFTNKVLSTGVDPNKFGAALSEDNLRSVAQDTGNDVFTFIGKEGSPFQTEAEYQEFLREPVTQEAIRVYKENFDAEIDPMFKKAQGLDPDVELPTRGLQTGARVNLKALLPDEKGVMRVGAGRGSMTATYRKRSPFARKATGMGQAYEGDITEIISNTYSRQLEIANYNHFVAKLIENGLGEVSSKRPDTVAGEEPSRPYPLQRRVIINDGRTFAQNENLWLPKSLESEFRIATGVDAPTKLPGIDTFNKVLTAGSIYSLAEPVGHIWNLGSALLNLPKGNLLTDTLLRATGRADVLTTLGKVINKSMQDNTDQLAELAEIGALRGKHIGLGPGSKLISWADRTTRLVLDDAYKQLADAGLVEKSETARREFVNQVGQYNARLQGPIMKILRDTGLGPFATAGRAFNVFGVRQFFLGPGVKAGSLPAAAALRANAIAGIAGFVVLRSVINLLTTGNAGGTPGAKLSQIDLGTKDEAGRPLRMNVGELLAPERGARVLGVRGFVESKRAGLGTAEAADAAVKDIISAMISPAWGPPLRFAYTAATGKSTVTGPQIAPPPAKGESEYALKFGTAIKEFNPLIASGVEFAQGKPSGEVGRKLLGRLSPTAGMTESKTEALPKIVERGRLKDYKEYIIHEANKLPKSKRSEYLREKMFQQPFTARDKAEVKARTRR